MNRLVILGGGESGVGTALLAKQKGWQVFLSDSGNLKENYRAELESAGIDYEHGGHTASLVLSADEVVKSPGIPDKAPLVKMLMDKGVPVIGEIEFASRYTNARKICITGSNGKTTTTLLIHHILTQLGVSAELAGNVGTSMARRIATGSDPDWYVIELSSFQLDGMFDFRADVAVLTNITPDHLDRYDYQFENYIHSKLRIIRNQHPNDRFVFCHDDAATMNALSTMHPVMTMTPFSVHHTCNPGAWLEDNTIVCSVDGVILRLDVNRLKIRGLHNTYNTMAALLALMPLGLDTERLKEAACSFTGVEHRLEPVGEVNGVLYINDSKATNVDSAWYALESMTRPVVWIAGGTDKGNDYTSLLGFAKQKVKALVCMGLDNSKLIATFGAVVPQVVEVSSMEQAVTQASAMALPGDSVLLSPCCASFDLFKNYEHRGDLFKENVIKLKIK